MNVNAVAWYTFVCIAIIIAFIQICSCRRLYSLRCLHIIQKRYPMLIMTESIAVIIFLMMFPFFINVGFSVFVAGNALISWIPPISLMLFVLFLETSRLWLISFNLHYLNASKNEKWKSLIDQNIINKDWYIRNKNTYGNQKKVLSLTMTCCVVAIVSVSISFYIYWNLGTLISVIFFCVAIIPTYVIYFKCRNYKQLRDNLLFFYEFKATIFVWSISLILYLIAELILYSTGSSSQPWSPFWTPAVSISAFASIFSISAPSLLSTLWIPFKFSEYGRKQSNIYMRDSIVLRPMKAISISMGAEEEAPDKQKLFEILKNEQQFESFIQFMFRDFSSEAMLGYIEMVQFKEYFVEEMGIKDDINCPYMDSLYVNVPKSSIVYDDQEEIIGIKRMKVISSKLCEKYIRIGSEYEVNISGRLRKKIIALNDLSWAMENKDFIRVFDGVLNDLFWFMRQSYERFIHD